MGLYVEPLTLGQANELVTSWHRHHKRATGHRFSLGVFDDSGKCHGAAIVGRPVSREVDQYRVCEVTRLVTDGTRNACSILYAHAANAAKAMGFWWVQTYTLASEPGTTLKAAGWEFDGLVSGRDWDTKSRRRQTDPDLAVDKARWKRTLNRHHLGLAA
jgi:hypothetical protein